MDPNLETHLSLKVNENGIADILKILRNNISKGFKNLKHLGQFPDGHILTL